MLRFKFFVHSNLAKCQYSDNFSLLDDIDNLRLLSIKNMYIRSCSVAIIYRAVQIKNHDNTVSITICVD